MKESERISKIYIFIVIWTVFIAVTLTGIVVAAEKTEYVSSGKEAETVFFSKTDK